MSQDTLLDLSRWQWALTAAMHITFPAVTVGTSVFLLDEPTEGLDTPTAARLLAGVRAFNPDAALVIALHDRQALQLPWTPIAHVTPEQREGPHQAALPVCR
jgi:ATPase subunit of ABC transporter with duplicated ATPase domains